MKINLLKMVTITIIGVSIALYVKNHKTPNEVNDSNISVSRGQSIFWLDNNRVLAASYGGYCTSKAGIDHGLLKFFEYDFEQNTSKNNDNMEYLACYNNGKIIYANRIDCGETLSFYSGFYEDKKESNIISGNINEINCSAEESELAAADKRIDSEALPRQLVDGHGWILGSKPGVIDKGEYSQFASTSSDPEYAVYPTALYSTLDGLPKEIDKSNFEPWIKQGYHVQVLRYEKFKDAYLLSLNAAQENKNQNTHHEYWWLYPNGVVEKIISFDSSDSSIPTYIQGHIIPAKSGNYLIGGGPLPEGSATHGLYKQNSQGSFDFILQGDIQDATLSPDGCKLAFARYDKIFDPNNNEAAIIKYNLQSLNLCEYQ